MSRTKINFLTATRLAIVIFVFCQSVQAQKSFVSVKDHQFIFNDKPYYYLGANYWYGGLLALSGDQKRGKERLQKELDFLHIKGINNLRVLAGVEGTGQVNGVRRVSSSLQPEHGKFNDDILTGLDYLLSEMGKRNMKAVIFLSNNWDIQHAEIAKQLKKPLVIEEFGLPRDNHSFNIKSSTNLREDYYRLLFAICNESRMGNGVIAGCNFWGFSGKGRAAINGNYWWNAGDDYTIDPPPEEQGLNSVFDKDKSTWKLIREYTKLIK